MATSCASRYRPSAPNSRVTCTASSRVGTMTMACGGFAPRPTRPRVDLDRLVLGGGRPHPAEVVDRSGHVGVDLEVAEATGRWNGSLLFRCQGHRAPFCP